MNQNTPRTPVKSQPCFSAETLFFSELGSREHEGFSLCTDFLNMVSKLLEVFLSGESRRYTISSPRKKQVEVIISYSLTYYSVIETFRFLQFHRQNIWACRGFGVKWTGGRSLLFWEAQQKRGWDGSPSLILTQCTSTKCLVRYNQRLARALLPSLALSLKHITKLVPCALQTRVWSPGNPWTGSYVCASGSQGCLSCKRTGPKPCAALGFVMTC